MNLPPARWARLALLLSVAGASAGAAAEVFEVPHRPAALRVDGRGGDWPESAPAVAVAGPTADGVASARAQIRIAWDRSSLWALFEVADATPSRAPADVAGARLFQWDSVEIYLDGGAHGAARMGPDDFQVLIAPDGRAAVLQGDPLLSELEAMAVPKRERPAVVIEAAGRETEGGYVVECAIPLAALGIAPRAGLDLRLDLALNDWTAAHEPFDQLGYDLDTLHKIERADAGESRFDEHGLGAIARQFEVRNYRPWSWSGSADFGYPNRWRRVRLVGSPPLSETLIATLGARRSVALGGLVTLLLAGVVAAATEWRHRRRIGALLGRISELETSREPAPAESPLEAPRVAAPVAAPAARPAPPPPDPLEWLERAAQHDDGAGEPVALELRAIRAVRGRLGEPLKPADLARAVYVSLRTLERHLGESSLGCSPGDLILAVKMREARRLLERGALQVQEVAHRVGYDDPAHFARRFRAYFGLAPTAVAQRAGERDRRSVA